MAPNPQSTKLIQPAKSSEDINLQAHKRKVRAIHDQKVPYIVDISEFAQRQNNIVLNALSFINEVSEGGVNKDGEE